MEIPFYYKEVTAIAAEESGLDKEFISDINKNSPMLLRDLYLTKNAVGAAVIAQHKIIERIAENGSCVIVGRAADDVLKEHPDVVRIFIKAPLKWRIERIMSVYNDSREQAEINIRRSDTARAAYYKNISGQEWGDESMYDFVVDSSQGINESVDKVLDYLANFTMNK